MKVIGVSPDTWRKHRNFKKKYELPMTLIADTDHAIADAYGVWVEKVFWGRKYWGNARTTFVIDGRGKIVHVFTDVDPNGHGGEVAKVVAAMK